MYGRNSQNLQVVDIIGGAFYATPTNILKIFIANVFIYRSDDLS